MAKLEDIWGQVMALHKTVINQHFLSVSLRGDSSPSGTASVTMHYEPVRIVFRQLTKFSPVTSKNLFPCALVLMRKTVATFQITAPITLLWRIIVCVLLNVRAFWMSSMSFYEL